MGAGSAKKKSEAQVLQEVKTLNKTGHVQKGQTKEGPKFLRLLSRFKLVNHHIRGTTLHECALLDDLDGIKEILEKGGADLEYPDHNGCTPLMCACSRSNNEDVIRTLIDARANVNHANIHKDTPLHFACDWDSAIIVRTLLRAKADATLTNCDGLAPVDFTKSAYVKECLDETMFDGLVSLCIDGLPPSTDLDEYGRATAAITALVEKKANLNKQDTKRNTPLMHATWHEQESIVEALLTMNADPCLQNHSGNTALHFAYEIENLELLHLLLTHGAGASADVENKMGLVPLDLAKSEYIRGVDDEDNNDEETDPNTDVKTIKPLDLSKAVKKNNIALVIKLIKTKANVNETDKKKSTPIMHATWNTNLELVELLLDNGADPIAQNLRLNTAMHFAFERNAEDIVNTLLVYGGTHAMDMKNSMGKLPMQLTVSEYLRWEQEDVEEEIAAEKEQKKKEKEVKSSKKGTLIRACKKKDYDKVARLLEGKANPNESDKKGSMPLIHASWHGTINIVEVLINFKADVNATNHRKNTALHFAYEKSNRLMVQFLLDHGAIKSLSLKNCNGKIPEKLTNKLYLRKLAQQHLKGNEKKNNKSKGPKARK